MKNSKKLLAMISVVILCFSACSGEGQENKSNPELKSLSNVCEPHSFKRVKINLSHYDISPIFGRIEKISSNNRMTRRDGFGSNADLKLYFVDGNYAYSIIPGNRATEGYENEVLFLNDKKVKEEGEWYEQISNVFSLNGKLGYFYGDKIFIGDQEMRNPYGSNDIWKIAEIGNKLVTIVENLNQDGDGYEGTVYLDNEKLTSFSLENNSLIEKLDVLVFDLDGSTIISLPVTNEDASNLREVWIDREKIGTYFIPDYYGVEEWGESYFLKNGDKVIFSAWDENGKVIIMNGEEKIQTGYDEIRDLSPFGDDLFYVGVNRDAEYEDEWSRDIVKNDEVMGTFFSKVGHFVELDGEVIYGVENKIRMNDKYDHYYFDLYREGQKIELEGEYVNEYTVVDGKLAYTVDSGELSDEPYTLYLDGEVLRKFGDIADLTAYNGKLAYIFSDKRYVENQAYYHIDGKDIGPVANRPPIDKELMGFLNKDDVPVFFVPKSRDEYTDGVKSIYYGTKKIDESGFVRFEGTINGTPLFTGEKWFYGCDEIESGSFNLADLREYEGKLYYAYVENSDKEGELTLVLVMEE